MAFGRASSVRCAVVEDPELNVDEEKNPLDLAALPARLTGQTGKACWRALEELVETPGFSEALRRVFPRQASVWDAHLRVRCRRTAGADRADVLGRLH